MNTPISGVIPELLAKKGYDEPCKFCVDDEFDTPMPYDCGMEMHKNSYGMYYSCPTIAQVIMWLYEKHEIWVSVSWSFANKAPDNNVKWSFSLSNVGNRDNCIVTLHDDDFKFYKTNTEAYLAAIEYTLKNLLK